MTGKTLGVAFVTLFFLVGGIGHFVAVDFFVAIMPPYVPFPREVVWISGAIELVLAAALWVPRWRPTVGWLLMALICAVTPANIHMWLHPQQFPQVPEWALTLRLALQLVLLCLVWWCTRPAPARAV